LPFGEISQYIFYCYHLLLSESSFLTYSIVSFVDSHYLEIGQNWVAGMKRLGLSDSLLLVALDRKSQSTLDSMGVATILRAVEPGDAGALWVHRLRVLSELLADGENIVHSDADAVWLQNPLQEWSSIDCDILFTQGTYWPLEAFETRRFVACCGCYAIKSQDAARNFLREALRRCEYLRDDQHAMNLLMPLDMTDWKVEAPYEIDFRALRITCSHSIMRSTAHGLSFGILPHAQYPRLILPGADRSQIKIAHPLSEKKVGAVKDVLKSHSLWFL